MTGASVHHGALDGFADATVPVLQLNGGATLRPLLPEDVTPAYVAALNDPKVNHFLIGPRRTFQTDQTVKGFVAVNFHAEDALLFGLFTEGRHHGTVRLHDICPDSAFVGLAIFNTEMWGKGWGTAMICAVRDYALLDLQLNCVRAVIDAANAGSQKAFEKAGFRVNIDSATPPNNQLWEIRRNG